MAQIKDFAIVAVALIGFIVLLGNFIKTIKDWRQPGMSMEQWKRDVNTKLDSDNKRIKSLEAGNRAICKGLLAMLDHELSGNSVDKIRKAKDDITNYLLGEVGEDEN